MWPRVGGGGPLTLCGTGFSQNDTLAVLAYAYCHQWPCTIEIAWVDLGCPYPGSYKQKILANRGQKGHSRSTGAIQSCTAIGSAPWGMWSTTSCEPTGAFFSAYPGWFRWGKNNNKYHLVQGTKFNICLIFNIGYSGPPSKYVNNSVHFG